MYLGADPELMVHKLGRIVSAPSVDIPEGKHDISTRIQLQGGRMSLYRDGYAAELNLGAPYLCRGDLGEVLQGGLREFLKIPKYQGLGFCTVPAVHVTEEEIFSLPPDAALFGCAPSRNAWAGGAEGHMEVEGFSHFYRYAGGHLWFSDLVGAWWTQHLIESVMLLDFFVGLPFSYFFDRPEQYRRREIYGRAGEYRDKTFFKNTYQGLEYRVLGPEWMNNSCFFSLAFGSGRYVLKNAESLWKIHGPLLEGKGSEVIQKAINTGRNLEDIMESFELEPYYSKGTAKRLRDDSRVGENRFLFRFLEVDDFHNGWFHTLNETKIMENTLDKYAFL
jgi:hypothetical protein